MPRRGSRAWLVHLLAEGRAFAIGEVYGEHLHPAELYENFRHYSRHELEEMAVGITSRKPGRPRQHWADAGLVAEVNRRLRRHSERRACELVARLWGMNPRALRMRYRRALKR